MQILGSNNVVHVMAASKTHNHQSFDSRSVLSRSEAKEVYDNFAATGHAGGKDASSGYGGPAVNALLRIGNFENATYVLDYGCGQGKLAELVINTLEQKKLLRQAFHWRGIDQSPKMVDKFRERCVEKFGERRCSVHLLECDMDPEEADFSNTNCVVDRFISTYCLDLLSEKDIYMILDKAQKVLDNENGLLLLAGITWGYQNSIKTFFMTALWELLYKFQRRKVGGCRPQALLPYLEARGWRIEAVEYTRPDGFPWMISEVISARPCLNPTN